MTTDEKTPEAKKEEAKPAEVLKPSGHSDRVTIRGYPKTIFFYPTDTNYGVLALSGSRFTTNSAIDGGALWVGWAQTAGVLDSTFDANVAVNTGGALLVYVAGSVSLGHDLFCGNTAQWGGGASVQWTSTDTWTANRFVENTATQGREPERHSRRAALHERSHLGDSSGREGGGDNRSGHRAGPDRRSLDRFATRI